MGRVHNAITGQAVPTIRLRDGACERLHEIFKCSTDGEVAERIGYDRTQLSRIRRGRSDVGPFFLARLLLAVLAEGEETCDLFDIVRADGSRLPLATLTDARAETQLGAA